MKVSKLALVLALTAGFGMASPTLAQKNKKEAAAPKYEPKLSKEFRNAAQPFQKALGAKDYAAAQAALPAVEAAATTPDEKYYVGQFKIGLGQGLNDQKLLLSGLMDSLNSGSEGVAPDRPRFSWIAGQQAFQAKDNANALKYLLAAKEAGYVVLDANQQPTRDLDIMLAETYVRMNQVPQGMQVLEQAIAAEKAAGRKAPANWYSRAASIAYQAKLQPEVAKWTRMQVEAYPTAENWRTALVIFGDANKFDDQTQLDLMRLQRSAGALSGERDYYEYAYLADKVGLPGEAQAIVDEGKAKGAYNASSKAINEIGTLAASKTAADKASLAGSETRAAAAANGRSALATGDAYFGYGNFTKAAEMYRLALTKGGIDANTANLRLGMALAKAGQAAEAKQAFAAVTSGPRQQIAQFWTLWVDQGARAAS